MPSFIYVTPAQALLITTSTYCDFFDTDIGHQHIVFEGLYLATSASSDGRRITQRPLRYPSPLRSNTRGQQCHILNRQRSSNNMPHAPKGRPAMSKELLNKLASDREREERREEEERQEQAEQDTQEAATAKPPKVYLALRASGKGAHHW